MGRNNPPDYDGAYGDEIPFEHGRNDRPWKKKMRHWEVIDYNEKPHLIHAHFCFNNGDEGLVFRTYPKGQFKTEVTAAFANGSWRFYKEIPEDD